MRLTVRFVGDDVPPATEDRIRVAIEAALGSDFPGAFIELRSRAGGFGVLAYSEAPVSNHFPSSGARPRPALGLGDHVEDVLRGLGLPVLL